jgi:hypothetical protein
VLVGADKSADDTSKKVRYIWAQYLYNSSW